MQNIWIAVISCERAVAQAAPATPKGYTNTTAVKNDMRTNPETVIHIALRGYPSFLTVRAVHGEYLARKKQYIPAVCEREHSSSSTGQTSPISLGSEIQRRRNQKGKNEHKQSPTKSVSAGKLTLPFPLLMDISAPPPMPIPAPASVANRVKDKYANSGESDFPGDTDKESVDYL
jgi:hypothetical protein